MIIVITIISIEENVQIGGFMKAVKIKEGIYWVGAVDWNVRNFHGYLTGRGTTYGAYLILDEKTALIDTVKSQFSSEMFERIADIVSPERINFVISNHVEMDHSGALPAVKQFCPNAQIYTSGLPGIKGLTSHYGELGYIAVKNGDSIALGKRSLSFAATPMLHWPDNMLAYCPEEKILFSNDAFGQHLASTQRFDDEMDLFVVLQEARKYYANIIMCYGKQAKAAWNIVKGLDIDIIAPAHGVVWRSHIKEILNAYEKWSANEPASAAIVVYDSMWQSTETLAKVITEAFSSCSIPVKLFDLKGNHISDIIAELPSCRYIAVGSPTLNSQMMPSVAAFLSYLKGLSPKNREAFAFGSYGWGGQSVELIEQELDACDFHLCLPGIKVNYVPTEAQKKEIFDKVKNLLEKKE